MLLTSFLVKSIVSGMNLKSWRKSEGLTQEDVAGRIGVDQAHYSKWERGANAPSEEYAKKILAVTKGKVTLADLVRASERG